MGIEIAGLIYAGLLVLGGLMGFLKKGSKMSLLYVCYCFQSISKANSPEEVLLPQDFSSMDLRYVPR